MTHISLEQVLDVHRALSVPLRLRILRLLLERELCVCEIMAALGEPQYKVSRHLAVLRKTGLLRDWKQGTWVHYEIDPDLPAPWRSHLMSLRDLLDGDASLRSAAAKLGCRAARPAGAAACAGKRRIMSIRPPAKNPGKPRSFAGRP
jgi:DNA-binding transcriptional ArsR family regulator